MTKALNNVLVVALVEAPESTWQRPSHPFTPPGRELTLRAQQIQRPVRPALIQVNEPATNVRARSANPVSVAAFSRKIGAGDGRGGGRSRRSTPSPQRPTTASAGTVPSAKPAMASAPPSAPPAAEAASSAA